MTISTKTIVKYLLEIIIVAFGVFLGVYFSDLNEMQNMKEEKEKSLTLILEELEYNQKLLEEQIDYHEKLKIQMDSVNNVLTDKDRFSSLADNKDFNHNNIKGWNGFQFARLRAVAFESAKISGILKEFDIQSIQKISSVYVYQESYLSFGNSILNKAIDTNSSTKLVDFLGIIELMNSDLLNLEKHLSENLKRVIEDLKT
ncbi:MAG: hypothetical protein AAGD88_08170 [Bacteroidota bacterium]